MTEFKSDAPFTAFGRLLASPGGSLQAALPLDRDFHLLVFCPY